MEERDREDENMHTESSLVMKSAYPLVISLEEAWSITTTAVHYSPAIHILITSKQLK